MSQKTKKQLLAGVTELVKSKVIGCNTLDLEYSDGRKAIRYHNTDVITTFPNGDTVLTSGGWKTATTKLRLERFSSVRSVKGIWYIKEPATNNMLPFYDGITFDAGGCVKGGGFVLDTDKINKVKKSIAKYVKLVDTLKILSPSLTVGIAGVV